MRLWLAIVICKLGKLAGRLLGGRGSSLPGKLALKICPDVLSRVKLPPQVIAISGSNGKTSTVEMVAAVLRAAGKTVAYNREGSNQIEGITTLILGNATFGGTVKADVLLMEADERYAARTFRYFSPTLFAVTNLYRDQLTRNGHPEWVFDALRPAVSGNTHLLLNADDPLSSCYAVGHDKVSWFGLEAAVAAFDAPTGIYNDGAVCPLCRAPMTYDFVHYNHIGGYRCTNCDHRRPTPDFAVTKMDLESGELVINDEVSIHLAFTSIYNVCNVLATYAVGRLCGVDSDIIRQTVDNFVLKNGRLVQFTLGAHKGTLLTSKHENSVAYDTNLRYIRQTTDPCTVMIIVDAVSRKYFTAETSWLWDIDFDLLNADHIQKVMLCGRYANDLAQRMTYTHLPPEKWCVCPSIADACEQLKAAGDEHLYVATCFSDKGKLLALVEKEDV
ncbi:MAG: DUF1727 domain-containing protein [Ruminococcaceae bacterium]|nr:DUF1727 domain-containing protein [Oscillospiraceae bacterium]